VHAHPRTVHFKADIIQASFGIKHKLETTFVNTDVLADKKVLRVGLFGPSFAGRPFADNSKGASEARRLQSAPEFSSISTAGRPLIVEPWQMQVRRTLPGPDDIVTFAADYLPHQLPGYGLSDARSA
jgi:hypothetical protein